MEGSCEYIEEAVADSRRNINILLQSVTQGLTLGWILLINDLR
jgi:hypothetical protein